MEGTLEVDGFVGVLDVLDLLEVPMLDDVIEGSLDIGVDVEVLVDVPLVESIPFFLLFNLSNALFLLSSWLLVLQSHLCLPYLLSSCVVLLIEHPWQTT